MSRLDLRSGADVVAFPPRSGLRTRLRAGDVELAVDLGDAIGSAAWWRGLLTLVALCAAAAALWPRFAPLPVMASPIAGDMDEQIARGLTTAPLAFGGAGRAEPAPMSASVIRLAEPPERPRISVTARLASTGGFEAALKRGGVGVEEAALVAALAAAETDVRGIKAGTPLDMVLGRRETKAVPRPLERLAFRAAFDLILKVARADDGALRMTRVPIAIDHTPLRLDGRVGRSFHRSTRDAGVPRAISLQLAALLAHRLDFERDIKGADRFSIVMEHQRAETGETITGGLLYAKLERAKGDSIEMLRWPQTGGRPQFFLADGSGVKKGLMRTPIDGARMTSGFGLRVHPILGYSRMHRGVDFGAGAGTPVLAAAAGRVGFAGWGGGYGNVVRIEHEKGLATAYAHLRKVHVRAGQRVEQGFTIGQVGSTGLSTGPHLHYEVWRNGKAVDPRSARFMSGPQVPRAEMDRFRDALERMRRLRSGGGEVAKAETRKTGAGDAALGRAG